ncbi:hypothetical protein OIU76_004665, partial [Salix suchowensis]
MSRYDSRSGDPTSYRDRKSGSGFGGASSYGGGSARPSSERREYVRGDSPAKSDLDGLTPFEKNFHVESPAVAAMSEREVEEYRQRREITVDGRDIPKPVKSFHDVGFP